VPREEADALRAGRHSNPHQILGPHRARYRGRAGVAIRCFHPDASSATCTLAGSAPEEMRDLGGGLFATFLPAAKLPVDYRLCFHFEGGTTWERDDPYRYDPTVSDMDLHLLAEGTHRQLWDALGARTTSVEGTAGTAFSVWAPNAERVSLVGDMCHWDGRLLPMRQLGSSGVFEIFVPGVGHGALYKFEIRSRDASVFLKTDPYARAMELPPRTSSWVVDSQHHWTDQEWIEARSKSDPTCEPMSIYEVHLGSWDRIADDVEAGERPLTYEEAAERLVDHVSEMGFTHIELMPIAEHAFFASWGYQVTGYFAPSARFGPPDGLRHLVNTCHRRGIGVILDWVPAHFPRDDFGLARFDGTPLYEHSDPRRGEHPDWGTLVFDYGRSEVCSFLLSNALYWLKEFHFDALRVDAVASMLYLDYSREEGQWAPNKYGGKEHLEAIDLLERVNSVIAEEAPWAFTVAEESTAWSGVTSPTDDGGLGFTFKWNMGWMHDTLSYFQHDPVHRPWHHNRLTFAMLYEHTEAFLNPLSHDEVVHGKGSLLNKMPGDDWQRFANLRTLFAYQATRPGKQLLFMGSELAPWEEWNHDHGLNWKLLEDPKRAGLKRYLSDLNRIYRETPPFWRRDREGDGFRWIDCNDEDQSVISYLRWDGEDHVAVILNLTPVVRHAYRVGVPRPGTYRPMLCSDAAGYGGSGTLCPDRLHTDPLPFHEQPCSIELSLPALSAVLLTPEL